MSENRKLIEFLSKFKSIGEIYGLEEPIIKEITPETYGITFKFMGKDVPFRLSEESGDLVRVSVGEIEQLINITNAEEKLGQLIHDKISEPTIPSLPETVEIDEGEIDMLTGLPKFEPKRSSESKKPSGLLVGPNDPMFGNTNDEKPKGTPSGARFDPFGPVPGPHHQPQPPIRPPMRGPAPAFPFGEPTPDHLQMPGAGLFPGGGDTSDPTMIHPGLGGRRVGRGGLQLPGSGGFGSSGLGGNNRRGLGGGFGFGGSNSSSGGGMGYF
eukprot:TRINITY_DN781831_c0_g1_i1.p1 TRINITY_DN781831_c0_g1~~TRINITY_DN781831_c0_g1_i1.p1  ORF type:complete len:269 (-),score=90.18 TRINITY_DN781831_c0_g1_i1:203-1009(-)